MPSFGGADLHSHSLCSDGVDAPERVAERAALTGLSAMALTDHDALHGIPAFEAACLAHGLVPVPGAELSVDLDGEDVHVLGLFLHAGDEALGARLASMREARARRGEVMVERLAALGFPLDLAELKVQVGVGSFGRPHVARALVARGYVATTQEAFELYLAKGRPANVPKARWTLSEAIGAVRRAGGLAVLAHAGWYEKPGRVVELAIEAGLDGLEALHPDHEPAVEEMLLRLAAERGLLVTAGSDCHGPDDARRAIGKRRLPGPEWARLLASAKARRTEAGLPPPVAAE